MGSLRVVRRPRPGPRRGFRSRGGRGLVAASLPVTDAASMFKTGVGGGAGSDPAWQAEAWEMFDAVGEFHYYVQWRASSCSRCRLIASEVDEQGRPTGGTEDERVAELVAAIAGGPLGQSQLIKRSVECLTVPGEYYQAILWPEAEADEGLVDGLWLALTREEIKSTGGGGVSVELPTGEWRDVDLRRDCLFRVWNPRARRAVEADSPARAALDSMREIVQTTRTISNAAKSRLVGNGVLFVPQEMSLPAVVAPTAARSDGGDEEAWQVKPQVQQLQDLLFEIAQVAHKDEDSMAALIPLIAAVPGDQVKNVMHLRFGNDITDNAIATRTDAITRLARSLDVSPERLLGLGGTNHWSAWQVGDSDVQLHLAPVLELICTAITNEVLRPVLDREGIDADRFVVWYDTSQLTIDPDKTDEGTAAYDRGAITAGAYREFLGVGESGYDLTSLEGWQQWAADQVSSKPYLLESLGGATVGGTPLIPALAGIVVPAAAPAWDTANPAVGQPAGLPGGAAGEEEPATEAVAAAGPVLALRRRSR